MIKIAVLQYSTDCLGLVSSDRQLPPCRLTLLLLLPLLLLLLLLLLLRLPQIFVLWLILCTHPYGRSVLLRCSTSSSIQDAVTASWHGQAVAHEMIRSDADTLPL